VFLEPSRPASAQRGPADDHDHHPSDDHDPAEHHDHPALFDDRLDDLDHRRRPAAPGQPLRPPRQ